MTKQNNGWIRTKDSMPPDFELVLIFWETESEKERQDVACWSSKYQSWLATEFAIPLNIRPDQVTHWQPLPSPPQKEDENGKTE